MGTESIFDLIVKGGFTIYLLIACSILALKVIIDKFFLFKGIDDKETEEFTTKVKLAASDNNKALEAINNSTKKSFLFTYYSPLREVFKWIINHRDYEKEELLDIAYNKLDKEVSKFEKGLGILATLGSISPFIGLFGTVIGIIKSFSALSVQDTQNYTRVMAGIAEALIATAAGLMVAVPSVMFYNYFSKKLRLASPVFDEAIHEVVHTIKKK